MSGQDQQGIGTRTGTHAQGAAGDALSKISEATQYAGEQAKQAATSLASEATTKVRGLMNDQIGAGADLVSHVAGAVRQAADDLERNIPQLAGVARGAADRIEEFSEGIRDKSIDELYRDATDFARRRPAVVFGATAALGFLMFRLLRSMPAGQWDQGQRYRSSEDRWPGQWPGDERWRGGEMRDDPRASWRPQSRADQFHGV